MWHRALQGGQPSGQSPSILPGGTSGTSLSTRLWSASQARPGPLQTPGLPAAASGPAPPLTTLHQVHKLRARGVGLPWPPAAEGTKAAAIQGVDMPLGLLPTPYPSRSQSTNTLTNSCVFTAAPNLLSIQRARLSHNIWEYRGPNDGQAPDYPATDLSLGPWGEPQRQVLLLEQRAHSGIFFAHG